MVGKGAQIGLAVVVSAVVALFPLIAVAQVPPPKDDTAVKEQTIYIPYKKLREVFEREGRVVFMPYDKFLELWRDRLEKLPTPPEVRPPVDSVISEITNVATVSKDVVTVKATLSIEVLKEGWNEVPLRLSDAAITKATLDGKPARIIFDRTQGYKLLVEKTGKPPQTLTLALEFAKTYSKAPGQNSVSFQAPQAPVSRWEVHVPGPGVKINIRPLLASTEVPFGEEATETVVWAFVGAAPSVQINWTPKAEGAKGLEALASVKAQQEIDIQEGVSRTVARMAYSISRAKLSTLTVEVPADQKVVNVFDPNVREWSVQPAGDKQRITVELFEPAEGTQNLTVELQRFAANGILSISAPVVEAVSVSRQQGVVVVRVAEGLRAEAAKRTGLLQVDAKELPAPLSGRKWQFSYRYATLPFELVLSVEKILPHIETDSLVEVHLQPEEMTLDMLAVYTVERAGVFRLELDIPAGYEVRDVRGWNTKGMSSAAVDTHHLEGPDKTHLVVNLSRKAMGRVGVAVQLHRALHEPDLLSPTGRSVSVPVVLPRVSPEGIVRRAGRVIIYAPESLRVNPGEPKGLRSIPFAEAVKDMRSTHNATKERPVLAYAYTDETTSLSLAAERRKPHVTARQLLTARIEPGVVTYDVRLFYDILYSSVKSLRLDVPKDLADDIRILTSGVRHEAADEENAPKDLAEGYVAWTLTGETEFIGSREIHLRWEKKIDKLDVGKSVSLAIPRLIPMDVDRAWGQIVLAKVETIDVRPPEELPESLRPIDPQHDLMNNRKVSGAARAFEFHKDWQLTVTATCYKLQDLKRTSIERALVRMVVTRSNVTSVQAIYRMRSQQQRLHMELPGKVSFDTDPLRINGRPVTLEQRGTKENIVSVPLVGQNPDEPFLLELRYTLTDAGHLFELPVFPEDPAVLKVRLSVYLPKELAYLGSIGPWTDELYWRVRGFSHYPIARLHAGKLIDWVSEGVNIDKTTLTSFQTDGSHYLFSTLRPLPDGSLRVVTLNHKALNVLVFILFIGGGVVMLFIPRTTAALAIGLTVVGFVLLAVFLPTLTRQIVDGYLIAWVLIVLVLWLLWYLVIVRPRRPKPETPRESHLGNFWKGLKSVLRRKRKPKPPVPAVVVEEEQPEAEEKGKTSAKGKGRKGRKTDA